MAVQILSSVAVTKLVVSSRLVADPHSLVLRSAPSGQVWFLWAVKREQSCRINSADLFVLSTALAQPSSVATMIIHGVCDVLIQTQSTFQNFILFVCTADCFILKYWGQRCDPAGNLKMSSLSVFA